MRALNIEAFAKTFTPILRSKNGFKVTKEGDHVVLYTFDNQDDLDGILKTKPWSFDKHLMVLQWHDKEVDVLDMTFNMVTFWVQVHDILIHFETRAAAEKVCGAVGMVDENIDESETMGEGFIKVHVTIDIS